MPDPVCATLGAQLTVPASVQATSAMLVTVTPDGTAVIVAGLLLLNPAVTLIVWPEFTVPVEFVMMPVTSARALGGPPLAPQRSANAPRAAIAPRTTSFQAFCTTAPPYQGSPAGADV